MRRFSKLLAMILTVTFTFMFSTQTAFAATQTSICYDLYANEKSETVDIDGVSYTYQYYYENGSRAINIVNNETGQIDKLIYNESASEMYINNEQILVEKSTADDTGISLAFTDGWESLSKDTYYITWGAATTAAVLAGMIAAYLGTLGAAGVIAAMGVTALGVIAANASGGTLVADLQWYYILFVNPQYRYEWSFTASTGDSYGPYISTVTF